MLHVIQSLIADSRSDFSVRGTMVVCSYVTRVARRNSCKHNDGLVTLPVLRPEYLNKLNPFNCCFVSYFTSKMYCDISNISLSFSWHSVCLIFSRHSIIQFNLSCVHQITYNLSNLNYVSLN